jgi:G6PDH family F420-dependent oxidoreductase
MFPGRFWVALGSGQLINEQVTGEQWPPKPERNVRLRECVDIIRALWAGETVTHHGLVHINEGKLWSLPEQPPLIVGAALSPETAEFAGSWADALITVNAPAPHLRQMVEAFKRGGGEGKPLFLQCHLSYAATDDEARANAFDQWRTTILPPIAGEGIRTPRQLEAAATFVRPEDMDGPVRISSDLGRHREWIQEDIELGFERLYLHNVGRNQQEFIEAFGKRVLPEVEDRSLP